MKTITSILFLLPVWCAAQVYDRSAADKFLYKEIGDTVFINNSFLVPGDTLFLGKGSAPDESFLAITETKGKGFFNMTQKFLPKEMSGKFLIYSERKKNRNGFFGDPYDPYTIVFISPLYPGKKYTLYWYAALEKHEVKLANRSN